MKRLAMGPICAASVAAACLCPSLAAAQRPYVPGQLAASTPPPYSPYLNLLRPGNQAINYYGLVRPQIAFNNSIQGLQSQINFVGAQVSDTQLAQTPLLTGHQTVFMNYSHFYGGGPGRPGAAPGHQSAAPAAAAPLTHHGGNGRFAPAGAAH